MAFYILTTNPYPILITESFSAAESNFIKATTFNLVPNNLEQGSSALLLVNLQSVLSSTSIPYESIGANNSNLLLVDLQTVLSSTSDMDDMSMDMSSLLALTLQTVLSTYTIPQESMSCGQSHLLGVTLI